MDPVSATPAHILLQQRKDRAATHSIQSDEAGASSAFASYAFGPMTLPGGKSDGVKHESKPEGAPTTGNPLKAPSMSWVTSVQGVETAATVGSNRKLA